MPRGRRRLGTLPRARWAGVERRGVRCGGAGKSRVKVCYCQARAPPDPPLRPQGPPRAGRTLFRSIRMPAPGGGPVEAADRGAKVRGSTFSTSPFCPVWPPRSAHAARGACSLGSISPSPALPQGCARLRACHDRFRGHRTPLTNPRLQQTQGKGGARVPRRRRCCGKAAPAMIRSRAMLTRQGPRQPPPQFLAVTSCLCQLHKPQNSAPRGRFPALKPSQPLEEATADRPRPAAPNPPNPPLPALPEPSRHHHHRHHHHDLHV